MNRQLETIWDEFGGNLRRFILKRTGNAQVAEDLLQDVFIKIHLHLDELDDEAKLPSWIYQITRNTIADYYRREKIIPLLLEESLPVPNDDEAAFRASLVESVNCMIAALPEGYRRALLMDMAGISQAEIGAALGISLSGAKSRVQRARARLQEMLWECCHFEFDRTGAVYDYYPRGECCSQCGCNLHP